MVFKADSSKKKEFLMCNFKRQAKIFAIILPLMFVYLAIIMAFLKPFKDSSVKNLIMVAIIFVVVSILMFLISYVSCYFESNKFDKWQIDLQDSHLVLTNENAEVSLNYYDLKSFKDTDDCKIFKFGLSKKMYLYWKCFENPEELKKKLDDISSRIGTFEKINSNPNVKTGVKFSKRYRIMMTILIVIIVILKILQAKFD